MFESLSGWSPVKAVQPEILNLVHLTSKSAFQAVLFNIAAIKMNAVTGDNI